MGRGSFEPRSQPASACARSPTGTRVGTLDAVQCQAGLDEQPLPSVWIAVTAAVQRERLRVIETLEGASGLALITISHASSLDEGCIARRQAVSICTLR